MLVFQGIFEKLTLNTLSNKLRGRQTPLAVENISAWVSKETTSPSATTQAPWFGHEDISHESTS